MTSPVDTSVKYLHSAMVGAPVLSGTAGALIAVLDACLVNGWGLKSVDSLVIVNNVATTNIASGHSAEVGSVVEIAGATPATLNGEQKVTAVTATSVSFATSGLTDQTATGAITLKLASLGWSKPFSGTNLAAYRSNDVTGTRMFLRVDDTATQNARVSGYENLTAISTGTGQFPTAIQLSGGGYWGKSNQANTTARGWTICGDSRGFYIFIQNHSLYSNSNLSYFFGDISSVKSNDPYACILSMGIGDESINSNQISGLHTQTFSSTAYAYIARSYTGIGSANTAFRYASNMWSNSSYYSGDYNNANLTPFPNPADGGLYTTPVLVTEGGTRALRGFLPGFYVIPQSVPLNQFAPRDTVVGITGLPSKTLRATWHNSSSTDGSSVSLIETTGPWR